MWLDKFKRDNVSPFEKELSNRDLLFISYEKDIPQVFKGLLITASFSFDVNGKITIEKSDNQIPEPSTIYFHLPIEKESYVPKLQYYPHYIELTPGQRFTYLTWLRNVEEPIDMGYVFLYYYGLERHLLAGNFEKAFDEIIKLRNAHENKSFHACYENALVHASILRHKTEFLVDLHEKTEISGYSNAMFLLAHNAKIELGIDQIILVFHKAFTLSRKPVKENRSLFIECLSETLNRRYGRTSFQIDKYNIDKVKTTTEARFANYSFPRDIQAVEITDFYNCKPLMEDLRSIFDESYESYKRNKRQASSGKSPQELEEYRKSKNQSRYSKLLKEKLITQEEYEKLIQYNHGKSES